MFKYDKKHPPIYGSLCLKDFEKRVNHNDFPKCTSCGNPIYNPEFYEESEYGPDMCGPCTTGEADTVMVHEEDLDFSKYYQD